MPCCRHPTPPPQARPPRLPRALVLREVIAAGRAAVHASCCRAAPAFFVSTRVVHSAAAGGQGVHLLLAHRAAAAPASAAARGHAAPCSPLQSMQWLMMTLLVCSFAMPRSCLAIESPGAANGMQAQIRGEASTQTEACVTTTAPNHAGMYNATGARDLGGLQLLCDAAQASAVLQRCAAAVKSLARRVDHILRHLRRCSTPQKLSKARKKAVAALPLLAAEAAQAAAALAELPPAGDSANAVHGRVQHRSTQVQRSRCFYLAPPPPPQQQRSPRPAAAARACAGACNGPARCRVPGFSSRSSSSTA